MSHKRSGVESSSCTQFIEFSHEWTIQNFSLCRGEFIKSPIFSGGANNNNNSKWSLTLYPYYNDEGRLNKKYLSLYLTLESSDRESIFVKYQMYLWNAKQKKFEEIDDATEYQFDNVENNIWGFPKFYERDSVLEKYFLSKDTLIVRCEICERLETVSSVSGEPNEELFKFESELANHFEELFIQEKFSDVTLSVGDQEFPAHKSILAARSPVFAAMFEHDMLEQRQSRVTITDVAPSVVKEMLIFIYTDKSRNMDNMAEDLLAVADKYHLSKLKRMCENVLSAKITIDNAADMLSLADLYRAEILKARAVTLISTRAIALMHTRSWKNMLAENSNLVREALLAINPPAD